LRGPPTSETDPFHGWLTGYNVQTSQQARYSIPRRRERGRHLDGRRRPRRGQWRAGRSTYLAWHVASTCPISGHRHPRGRARPSL